MKQCSHCKKFKPETKFHKNRSCKDGLHRWCKECVAEYAKNHKKEIRERKKEYYQKNANKIKEYHTKWYKEHPDIQRKCDKKWRKTHPLKVKAQKHRNRAKRLNIPGSHTETDMEEIFLKLNGKCAYCGRKLGTDYHIDHIIPLSRGGTDNPDNLTCACPRCNLSKNNHLLEEWTDRPIWNEEKQDYE